MPNKMIKASILMIVPEGFFLFPAFIIVEVIHVQLAKLE